MPAAPPRQFGALTIDVAARLATIDEEPILLTRTEFDLLKALSARPGVVLSRRQLLEAIRNEPWVGNDHLVDVHIGHLRRKLGMTLQRPASSPRFGASATGWGQDSEFSSGERMTVQGRDDGMGSVSDSSWHRRWCCSQGFLRLG